MSGINGDFVEGPASSKRVSDQEMPYLLGCGIGKRGHVMTVPSHQCCGNILVNTVNIVNRVNVILALNCCLSPWKAPVYLPESRHWEYRAFPLWYTWGKCVRFLSRLFLFERVLLLALGDIRLRV